MPGPHVPSLSGALPSINPGTFRVFTSKRRPVTLVYSEYFDQIVDAIAAERKVKGWTRAKKEALMAGNFERLEQLSRRRTAFRPHGSRRVATRRSSP
jgi:putative endonuclease